MSDYEIRLKARRSGRGPSLSEIWEYRDLVRLLVKRDFSSKYAQTVFGPLWFLLQPLINTTVFAVVFGKIAKLSTDGQPSMLFYMCGMLSWSYFSSNFTVTSGTLINNIGLFGKVYFPRITVPLASVISNLFAVGFQLILLICFIVYYRYALGWEPETYWWKLILLPLVLVQIAGTGFGVGLIAAAMTVKYRDISHLSGFIINIWFYATPVIFPLATVPESYRWILLLNPMTLPQEACRNILIGGGLVTWPGVVISCACTMVAVTIGMISFQRCERTFIDTV